MNEYLISSFRQQLKEDPKSRIFFRLAEELRKGEAYTEAAAVCEEGLSHHPRYVPALVCLGRCQRQLKQTEEAEASFRQVLSMAPDNTHALLGLSDVLEESGRSEDALPYLETLVMLAPDETIQNRIDAIKQKETEPAIVGEQAEHTESAVEPLAEDLAEISLESPESYEEDETVAWAVSEFEEAAAVADQGVPENQSFEELPPEPPSLEEQTLSQTPPEEPSPEDPISEEVPPFEFDIKAGESSDETPSESDQETAPPVMIDGDDSQSDLPSLDDSMPELAAEDLEDFESLDDHDMMEIDELSYENSGPVPEVPVFDDEAPASAMDDSLATVAVNSVSDAMQETEVVDFDAEQLEANNMEAEHVDQAPAPPLEVEEVAFDDFSSEDIPLVAVNQVPTSDPMDLPADSMEELDDLEDLPEIAVEDLEDLPELPAVDFSDPLPPDLPLETAESLTSIDDLDREFERAIHEVDEDAPPIFETDPEPHQPPASETSPLLEHVFLSGKSPEQYLQEMENEEALLTTGLKHEKMEHYEEALKLYEFLESRHPGDARYREHVERARQMILQEDKKERKIRLLSNWYDKLRGGYHVS